MELKKLYEQKEDEHHQHMKEFDALCKSIDNLEASITLTRSEQFTTSKTPLELITEVRRGDEFKGILIANIFLKRLKAGKLEKLKNEESEKSESKKSKELYDDDINALYLKLRYSEQDINTVNEDGDNALHIAVQKTNILATFC